MNYSIHALARRHAESIDYRGRVVDLGCGTAPYKAHILKTAREYVGVDWSNSYHDDSNVDVYASLIETLPFPDDHADMVVSFQVMEHLPEPAFFLKEAHRILRPGGQIHLAVPFMWHVHEAPHDYFRYTRYGLEYLLTSAGFERVQIRETTGYWHAAALKFNYHIARYPIGPFRRLLIPIWWLTQTLGPWLDKWDRHPAETAGYTACAEKRSA